MRLLPRFVANISKMKTVNSLSGGKTSSYLAVHYPSDYEIFSLVCNDDPKCAHPDKKLMQVANDKLSKYCPQFGEFIGTPEHYGIIKIMLDLEQMIGREIIWVRGESFDSLIRKMKAIPNQNQRWCTTYLKLEPIFWFWLLHIGEKVRMRAGFRHDEKERADRFTTSYKTPTSCNNYGQNRQSWQVFEDWRQGEFPLIEAKVNHFTVKKYWDSKGIDFPKDSNCQMCFWKPVQQLRQNYEESPNVINWADDIEKEVGNRFLHKFTMEDIKRIGLQLDFMGGAGMYCNVGNCTD